jgi:predicted TIM-barrel fold metal-dependent hydrolase
MPSPDRGVAAGVGTARPDAGGGAAIAGVDTHGHVFLRAATMIEGRRYTPSYDATLGDYLGMLDGNGMSHGVLVQISILGTDNSLLLEALRREPDRLRGIVVVPPEISENELHELDRMGVVGVRLNLIGLPNPDLARPEWREHLRRLADLGWQVEVQAESWRLPLILPPLLDAGVRIVVDHFGRPDPALGVADPGFRSLLGLAGTGRVWVKLSGAYRNGAQHERETLASAAAEELLRAFGARRLVWGSDWPHSCFEQPGLAGAARLALDRWVPCEADRRAVLIDTPAALFRFSCVELQSTGDAR